MRAKLLVEASGLWMYVSCLVDLLAIVVNTAYVDTFLIKLGIEQNRLRRVGTIKILGNTSYFDSNVP